MNKAEFVARVAEKAEMTKKDAERAVNAFAEAVQDALRGGDKVSLVGFGTFEVRHRAARKGRNPRSGEEIEIKATSVPAFKAGKILRDAVEKS